MSTWFLYVRKSTEEDDRQIASISAQIAELRELAARNGITISRTFEEAQSARTPGRPVFGAMMAALERRPVAGILCWKPDRLARNALDGGQVIDALDRRKIGQILTPGRTFRNTGDDKFMLNLDFGMSKKYVDDLSDNVKRGNRAVLQSGRWTGIVPLGYLKESPAARGRGAGATIPDPERFPLVRALFRRFLSGTMSLHDATIYADKTLGLRTRGTRRHPAGPLPLVSIHHMLHNPFYSGVLRHGDEVYEGAHVPVVTAAEFARVQAILKTRHAPRPKRYRFTYRGLLRCSECGRGTTSERHVNRFGSEYVYYRCSRRKNELGVCERPHLEERWIDHAIEAAFRDVELPPGFEEWALAQLDGTERAEAEAKRATLAAARRRIEEISLELERLTTLCVRGVLDESDYLTRKQALVAERLDQERTLRAPEAHEQRTAEKVRGFVQLAAQISLAFRHAPPEERRRLVGETCARIEIRRRGVTVSLVEPLLLLGGEGSNPTFSTEILSKQKAIVRVSRGRTSTGLAPSTMRGSNPHTSARFPLKIEEDRADAEGQTARSSTWQPQGESNPYLPRERGLS